MLHVRAICAFAALAVRRVGALGALATWGVPATLLEGTDVPTAFVAVTLTEYVVPLVSPEIVHESAPVVVHVLGEPLKGDAVAV